MKRNVYLKATELNEIPQILQQLLIDINYKPTFETISIYESIGRITEKSVFSKVSSPAYNGSAMDGIAIKASSTFLADETNPVILKKDDFQFINTGNVLPGLYDAVVMIEDVQLNDDESVTIYRSSRKFENVRAVGEDITKGNLIISKNHVITSVDLSALISGGVDKVSVYKKLNIAIIPTGDEIIDKDTKQQKGLIKDSNSYYLKNELLSLHHNVNILPIQRDDYKKLEEFILNTADEYDLILIGAGSSAGSKDYAKAIIENNGKVYVHGINIKPGKPTIIGSISDIPVIGMPGYPVSTYMAFREVVKPLLSMMVHQQITSNRIIKAKLVKKVYSSLRNYEFVRVSVGEINGEIVAVPLNRKASVTMSLVKAQGILKIPKNSEGYQSGDIVDIELIASFDSIKRTLFVMGSHDILFDLLTENLLDKGVHLVSNHVGSFGGIMSIHNDGCHIAPVHVMDENGIYNRHIIQEYLNDEYVLIKGVERIQGIYTKRGNPKRIKRIDDLARVNIVNRQRGSGTRILLDYLLKESKINPESINGYNIELTTHIQVAEAVKDERFDAGLGVQSVATLAEVDFVEIGKESYDFIVKKDFLRSELVKKFIEEIRSERLIKKLTNIGGYELTDIGTIIE